MDNLRHSFPEKSETERTSIMRGFYLHMAYLLVEWVKLLTLPKAAFLSRVQLHIPENVQQLLSSQKTILFYTGHVANWEWALASGGACLPMPIVALARRLIPAADATRRRPPQGMLIRRILDHVRSRFGITSYHVRDATQYFRRSHKTPSIYTIAGDLCPSAMQPMHGCMFFGRAAGFFQGVERIPRLLNVPVVFIDIARTQKGYYRSALQLLAMPPYAPYRKDNLQILPLYVSALEKVIRRNPSDWLWSHKRWKHTFPSAVCTP